MLVGQKLEDIQSHSKRWMALFQHSYFGRNLIVQGMYFGKQRYWLFSLVMPDSCMFEMGDKPCMGTGASRRLGEGVTSQHLS
jgi:hypothetical protein